MNDTSLTALDRQRVRTAFDRAAQRYDRAAVLQREIADRLLARLDLIKHVPRAIADIGCGTGYGTRALRQRYTRARVFGIDLAPGMVFAARGPQPRWWQIGRRRDHYLCGDAERLPIGDRSVDFIFSNLVLQWCDLDRSLREFARILRPGGLLMFTSFGPDTLKELRDAWRAVDRDTHVHDFIDMHDVGDALVRAQFAEPVMDVERLVLTYPNVRAVLKELKELGAHNAARNRPATLTGKQRFAKFERAYAVQQLADGTIPASYEVVYGHAWAPTTRTPSQRRSDGSVVIPLRELTGRHR